MAKRIENWKDLLEHIGNMEIEDSIHIENSTGVFKITKKKGAPLLMEDSD